MCNPIFMINREPDFINSLSNILVVSYSQTGQLSRIIDSLLSPILNNRAVTVKWVQLEPLKPYPFPWPITRFFDIFPECVTLNPPEILPISISKNESFDLIILAYQVWFLSPSLPMTAFLKSKEAAALMRGKPVITVIGCKDTWVMAQERVKDLLNHIGSTLIDNVAVVDRSPRFYRMISTQRWLWTGKKEPFLKIFPPAGISEKEIYNVRRFGAAILKAIETGRMDGKTSLLKGLGAVKVDKQDIFIEKFAYPKFIFWATLISRNSMPGQLKRSLLLIAFSLTLLLMILTGALADLLLYPFRRFFPAKNLEKEIEYFEKPSGSSKELMSVDGCIEQLRHTSSGEDYGTNG